MQIVRKNIRPSLHRQASHLPAAHGTTILQCVAALLLPLAITEMQRRAKVQRFVFLLISSVFEPLPFLVPLMQDGQDNGGCGKWDTLVKKLAKWLGIIAVGIQAYATPRPIGRPRDVSVGLAHVSAVLLSVQAAVAADEGAEPGVLRTRVAVGTSWAKTFRWTKPTISDK